MPLQTLFDAFLALLNTDEWEHWGDDEVNHDFCMLANAARVYFKFPRVSLDWDDKTKNFVDDKIGNAEIQVWANYMKCVWYTRVIDGWENLRPLYTERDFSPAKQLGEYRQRYAQQLKVAEMLENNYYRSINGKPFDYSSLAGV